MSLDILEVAHRYLSRIHKVGSENISACCPFPHMDDFGNVHYERSPSFSMSITSGLWHCFSCKSSGTLYAFLRDVAKLPPVMLNDYAPMLRKLQSEASNHLQTDFSNPAVVAEEPIPEALLGMFRHCPLALVDAERALELDPDDPVVFDEALLQKLEIGFDEAHQRITFPLRDMQGQLVGISGRAVNNQTIPRYKIYDTEYASWELPERPKYPKGNILWNAHNVLPLTMTQLPFVICVEGFRGCMHLIQKGVLPVVALIGSFLSSIQQWILERLGCEIILMLDNDQAGFSGTEFITRKLRGSVPLSIARYEEKQPTRLSAEQIYDAIEYREDCYDWTLRNTEKIDGLRKR